MPWSLAGTWEAIQSFVNSGGPILYAIAVLTFVLWTLAFERIWFYRSSLKSLRQQALDRWEARSERKSWNAHQIRTAMLSRVTASIRVNLALIGTVTALCPLFGLLGTVWGMMEVFNVLSTTGGADAKSMAAGVKQATIPTMAGMVAAISGVFAGTLVNQIADREERLLADRMTMDH